MKIHRLLIQQVVAALSEIFKTSRHADKVIEFHFKNNRKWGARDRRFFAESVYEVVRWRRLFWHLANFDDKDYLDAAALTPERVEKLWAVFWLLKMGEPQEGPEFRGLDVYEIKKKRQSLEPSALSLSFSDEMFQIFQRAFPQDGISLLKSLNLPADVFLRANQLKVSAEELKARLREEALEAELVPQAPAALRLVERKNVFTSEAFKKGFFEVQDLASQQIAPLLKVEPGQRVVDACAGAGGKSLHLAALMKNKGKILSLDVHERKLEELRVRARRNGIDIIETRWIENSKVIKRLEGSADRVLLDVPCSGTGVLRRNPDTKWKVKAEEIQNLQELQFQILSDYSRISKIDGRLVYATCSVLPQENQDQIQKFLSQNAGSWTLEEEIIWRPDQQGADGFYGARLRRLK